MTTLSAVIGAASGLSPNNPGWLWQALTSRLSLVCLAILIGGTALLVLGLRVLVRLGRRQRARRQSLLADQSGAAMLEFAMVFPILLFLILLLTQTTLVMAGNLYVHYAAFTAARSAVVVIPADYTTQNEPPNTIIPGPGFAKYDRIRLAAVWALVPVSGKLTTGAASADAFSAGLSQYFTAYNRPVPNWVTAVLPDRVRYADANTSVSFFTTVAANDPPQVTFTPIAETATTAFGPKDPITVEVTHRLNLSIPYVRFIFSDGLSSKTSYRTIKARYTLTNEGIDTQLPPKPTLDRTP